MTDGQAPTTATDAAEPADPFTAFFSYRGRIGRGQYWIGIAIAFGLLVVAFGALASAMNPTGSGAPFLAIPLLIGFFWIHSLVTIKRLRDAGFPGWHYVLYGIGPFVWLALTMELIEYIGLIIGIGLLAFFVVPGLFPGKAAEGQSTADAPTA